MNHSLTTPVVSRPKHLLPHSLRLVSFHTNKIRTDNLRLLSHTSHLHTHRNDSFLCLPIQLQSVYTQTVKVATVNVTQKAAYTTFPLATTQSHQRAFHATSLRHRTDIYVFLNISPKRSKLILTGVCSGGGQRELKGTVTVCVGCSSTSRPSPGHS